MKCNSSLRGDRLYMKRLCRVHGRGPLAGDLRDLRRKANNERAPVVMTLERTGDGYAVPMLNLQRSLPRGGTIDYRPLRDRTVRDDQSFAFYPGGATGGRFDISTRGRVASVFVHWLTGRNRVE